MNPHNMLEALSEILDKYVKTGGLSTHHKFDILDTMADKFLEYKEREAIERLRIRQSRERANLSNRIQMLTGELTYSN